MNEIITINHALSQINTLIGYYQKISRLSGEDFNIFKVMMLHAAEVRTHSAILGEFLNPEGTHGQGDLFLKLFIKQFNIVDFDTKTAKLEIEKFTGMINEDQTEGGRLDILLTDGKLKRIIIENKIYAVDQENQLLRYYNFDNKARLFYLTLTGTPPSKTSTGDDLSPEKYQLISYSYDILQWLQDCKKEATSLPIIRESIGQYSNLLRTLTNQTTMDQLKNEIGTLLSKHPEYIEAVIKSYNSLNSILIEVETKFSQLFREMYPSGIISLPDGEIRYGWGEEEDIYFHYSFFQSGLQADNSETGLLIKALISPLTIPNKIESNLSHICWFIPDPFKQGQRFKDLNKAEIIKMYLDEAYLKDFIAGLIKEEQEFRTKLIEKLQPFNQLNNISVPALN